jgi:hypothetical protein
MVSAVSWFILTSGVLTRLGACLLGYAAKAAVVFQDGSTLGNPIDPILEEQCHIPAPGGLGE